MTLSRPAQAQAINDANLRKEIGDRARQAEDLLDTMVAAGSERPDIALSQFQTQQTEISVSLADIFNKRMKEEEWIFFVSSTEYHLAVEMQQRSVRIAPTNEDVNAAINRSPKKDEPKRERMWEVILEIVLEAAGIAELAGKIIDFAKGNAGLQAILRTLGQAIRNKHFAEVAFHLRRLMETLVAPQTLLALEAAIGKEAAMGLLKGIAARFVPFVGWALFISSLLASMYRHRDRLANAQFP